MTRRWLVWIDDTPQVPDRPLVLTEAVGQFLAEIVNYPDNKVEIRQCTADDLAGAGVA